VSLGFHHFFKGHEVPVYTPLPRATAAEIAKNLQKLAIFRVFCFTSPSLFRIIKSTREGQSALGPNKNGPSAHLCASRNLETGGSMANQRMTQTQLVRGLAEAGEVTNKQSRAILEHLSSLAVSEVKKNGVFVLPGIGRLVRVDRKARMGRNPATGETIKIPAKKVVKFRVAKAAKDAIVPPKVKK
jgi:DNA-binding protein HU-beta